MLAYIQKRIDRYTKNIKSTYKINRKRFIDLFLKKSSYPLRFVCIELLHAYQNLDSIHNYTQVLSTYYNQYDLVKSAYGKVLNEEFEDLEFSIEEAQCIQDLELRNFVIDSDHLFDRCWCIHFWIRRYKEGNIEVVADILKDLKKQIED